jgi:hypothetical protein
MPSDDRVPELKTVVSVVLAALVILGAGGLLADMLVETDRERLDEVVELLQGGGDRIDRIATYADAERVPVAISDRGGTERLRDPDGMRERLHEVLAPLDARDAEITQITSTLDGDRGRVTLRVRTEGEVSDLELTLRRDGQTFLLVGARRIG